MSFILPRKLFFEGVKCDEVIAFDDEVFSDCAVLVALDRCYVLFPVSSMAFSNW